MFKVACPFLVDSAEFPSEPIVLFAAAALRTAAVVVWWFLEDVLTESHFDFYRPLMIAGFPI